MKYEISDIKRVLSRLVIYFRVQEDASSQQEMNELWRRIDRSIDTRRSKRRLMVWSSVSAAALLAGCIWLGVGHYWEQQPDLSVVAARMMEKTVETDEIQLIVTPEHALRVKDGGTVIYTQDGDIHVDEDKLEEGNVPDHAYNQIVVPKGRFGRLILADGSELYINSGTKVVYPKRFEKNRREIFVDGEIYIDVRRDETAPFVVKTARFDVEVLGTAFDVKAYSHADGDGEIVLLRGLVNVKSKSGAQARLEPDSKAVVPSEGNIRTTVVNASDYILWIKGILPLDNGTVGDIADDLERYYDVKILCDKEIKDIRIDGKFDLQQGVEKALHNLSQTGGFVCSKQADAYILRLPNGEEPEK